jgi:hypothetical protein
MSGFSAVDDSVDPGRLVRLLDAAALAESGMKQYAVAAHALRRPTRPILDVGRGGGLVTAFEPDWSSFAVRSDVLPECASWITSARHPDMGARLWKLLEEQDCDVLDRVEELSV